MELTWDLMIVIYLFTAGLSAGSMITSNLAFLYGGKDFERVGRFGAYISPFPISLGLSVLLLDLGSPFNFYRLFMTLQVRSPMSLRELGDSSIYYFKCPLPIPLAPREISTHRAFGKLGNMEKRVIKIHALLVRGRCILYRPTAQCSGSPVVECTVTPSAVFSVWTINWSGLSNFVIESEPLAACQT